MKTNQLFNLNNKEINTFINQLKSPVYIFDFKSIKCDTDVSEVNNSDNSPQFLYELYINQDYYYSKNENYINDSKDKFVEIFIKHCGEHGDIIVSDIALKRKILNDLCENHQSYEKQIMAISDRLKDIMPPLINPKLYKSAMTDTSYLKTVIKSLCPHVNYKTKKSSSEAHNHSNARSLIEVITQLSLYCQEGLMPDVYAEIKRYIKIYGKLSVSFYPVPIPDVEVDFDFSEDFSKLKSLLGSFWFNVFYENYVSKFTTGGGSFTFTLTENDDFYVDFNTYDDYSWDDDYTSKFQNELLDYGLLRFLNRFYTKKYINQLIYNEIIHEDDDCNDDIDVINDLIDVTFNYNSVNGLIDFKLKINHSDTNKSFLIDCYTKQYSVIEKIAKKVSENIIGDLKYNNSDVVSISCTNDNSISVSCEKGPYSFTISKPKILSINT